MDENTARAITRTIKQHVPDAKIVVFGSRARGDHYADSDIDIAVISHSITDKAALHTTLSRALHDAIDAPMDILLYTPQEYESGKDGLLPELIEKEGVTLTA